MTFAEAVEGYLETVSSTLWGRAWDTGEEWDRRHAAKWFVEEFHRIKEYIENGSER